MKAIIVDNEFMPAKHLENSLRKYCPQLEELIIFQNPTDAILRLKKNKPDVVFLDIEMPEMSGFEFVEIVGVENMPPLIFTTAYSKYAIQAFKVRALDYLLKPIDPKELISAIERLTLLKNNDQVKKLSLLLDDRPPEQVDRIVLSTGHEYFFARAEGIIRVQGSGSYTQFFLTADRKIMTSKSMSFYSDLLIAWGFIRTHQSHMVNPNFVEGFDKSNGGELLLKLGGRVPVSTRLKSKVLSEFGLR